MLERKGVEHEVVSLLPGVHAVRVRAAGFPGATVPALRLADGRRIQGSLRISRALDELAPDPPLFPADPARRAAVEEAEAWGERELQPVPRRLVRWALASDAGARRAFVGLVGMPAPRVAAVALAPMAKVFARRSGADAERVRADLAALPTQLDHVDALIADGTIGTAEPNAADFQIGATVRALLAFDDLRDAVEGRPAADHARRLLPDFPGPVPAMAPAGWRPR